MADPSPSGRDDAIVAEAAQYAVKFHQLGMLAEAERFYDAILKVTPDHFQALHLLGILRQQQGNSAEALRLTGEALETNSRSADALRTLGAVLDTLERHEEALAAYDQALAANKDRAEALVSYGIALVHLGRNREALDAFDATLAIDARHLEARINRGVALTRLGRIHEALEAFDAALAVREDHPEALVSRGVALLHLGRAGESLAAFDQALAIKPDHAMALSNRVLALVALRRHAEVLEGCERALSINPGDAETLYLRGNTLWSQGKFAQAIESYEQAWAFNHARALSMLALYRSTIADWAGDFIYPFVSVVFGFDPLDQLHAARNYLRVCLPTTPQPSTRSAIVHSDRLRIAYVSSDFRQHAVASATVELFERHDRNRFKVIGVSLAPSDASAIRARLVDAFDQFHDVASDGDGHIAGLLNDLAVHIAVDLNGPTEGSRPGVWAYRAAPVQVAYLGYPATAGADFIDYILADETVLPFDQQPFFSEKIVHLPDCYHANDSTKARKSPVGCSASGCGCWRKSPAACCGSRA